MKIEKRINNRSIVVRVKTLERHLPNRFGILLKNTSFGFSCTQRNIKATVEKGMQQIIITWYRGEKAINSLHTLRSFSLVIITFT